MALTKVTGHVVKTDTNIHTHNINSSGIVTSIGLDINGNADISGNLGVGGTLTYQDVTSIDAVGIITAQSGIQCLDDLNVGLGTFFVDKSAGTVGIGTDNPGRVLTIRHSEPRIRLIDNDTNSFSEVYTDNTGHLYLSADAGQSNGGSRILFNVDGTEKVRINNVGQVGISTSANLGDAKLTVEGVTTLANIDQTIMVRDSNADDAVGRGGNIGFGAYVNGSMRSLGGIGAIKRNAGNSFNGDLALYTRENGEGNLSERLRIKSNGHVGINSATPSYPLDVWEPTDNAGWITISGSNTTYDTGFLIRNGTNNKWFLLNDVNGSGGHTFEIRGDGNNSDRFLTITQAGLMGLGTVTPESLLHLKGAAPRITLTDTAGSEDHAKIFSTGGALYLQQRDDSAHGKIIFRTEDNSGAIERLRIDSSGNTLFRGDSNGGNTAFSGFGTNNWAPKVQVLHSQGALIARIVNNDAWGGALHLASANGTYASPSATASGDIAGGVYFHAHDGGDFLNYVAGIEAIVADTVATNDTPGYLKFSTTADGTNVLSERLRITSAGKVGIGITNPNQPVSISGRVSIDVNNDYYGVWADGSTTGENHISVGRWYNTGGGLKSGYSQYGINNLILENNHPTAAHTVIIQPRGQKVAIGTHISDGLVHIGQTSAGTVSANAGGDELVLESSGNTGMSILSPGTGESTIFFGNPGTNGERDGYIRYYHEAHSTTANRRSLVFITGGGDNERLRITSDGDMGLGATNPGADPAIGNDATVFEIRQTTSGLITSGNNRKGAVLRLKHEAQWENGYQNSATDDLGRIEFVTGDSSTGEGVRSIIRTRNLQYWNNHALTFEVATGNSTTISEKLRLFSDVASFGNDSPPGWQGGAGYYNIQLGKTGFLRSDTDTSNTFMTIGQNAYKDSGGWKYTVAGGASNIFQQGGVTLFERANSGSADGAITWLPTLRLTIGGDIVTQGLTSPSYDNDGANTKIVEVTGDGTVGEYGQINISGNQNTNNTTIGSIKFVNRENSATTSGSNAGSRQLGAIEMRTDTSDSNAGDDCGGLLRIITKTEAGGNVERMRFNSDGTIHCGVTGFTDSDIRLIINNPANGSGSQMQFQTGSSGNTNTDGARFGYNGSGAQIWNFENNYVRFGTNNIERFLIRSDGSMIAQTNNLGTTPLMELNNSDGSSQTGTVLKLKTGRGQGVKDMPIFHVIDGNNATLFEVENSGRVGIFNDAPAYLVDIVNNTSDEGFRIKSTGSTYHSFYMDAARSAANQHIGRFIAKWSGTNTSMLAFNTGSDVTNKDNGYIDFCAAEAGGTLTSRFICNGSAAGLIMQNDCYISIPHDQRCIVFDEGQKMITSNDGQGNFNFIAGKNHDAQHVSSSSGNSGVSQIEMQCDGSNGAVFFGVGPTRSAGSTASFTNGFKLIQYSSSSSNYLNGLQYTTGSSNSPSGMGGDYPVIHKGNAHNGSWNTDSAAIFKCLGDGGSIAITTNDGGGNCNVCFNHSQETPDTNGSSWRIRADIDSANSHFYIQNNSSVTSGQTTSMTNRLEITESGTFYGSSSNNISDQRLKKNIATITNATAKIKGLKGRTFEWKEEAELDAGTQYGFIAQEMETVVSDLVSDGTKAGLRSWDKDGNLLTGSYSEKDKIAEYSKGVNVDGVVPILVEALKEAINKIETLETKVATLEGS